METLDIIDINSNINQFIKRTQNHFTTLKKFLQKEFVLRINNLEDKVELTPQYLKELMNLKTCLLEVQQRFFEMRHMHKDGFLGDLESMILQLV